MNRLLFVFIIAALAADLAAGSFTSTMRSLQQSIFGQSCAFVDDPARAVNKELVASVFEQDAAIMKLTASFVTWEQEMKADQQEPMVLVFAGGSGLGKTLTANHLAKALLPYSYKDDEGLEHRPGFLVITGAQYGSSKYIDENIHDITKHIVDHLIACDGHALILIDEVQKAQSEVLQALESAFSMHMLRYNDNGSWVSASTKQAIFIIVSDIGTSIINGFLQTTLRSHKTITDATVLPHVNRALEKAVNKKWHPMDLSKYAKSVVFFQPFSPPKLKALARRLINFYTDTFVKSKMIQSVTVTPEFLDRLVAEENRFISYVNLYDGLKNEKHLVSSSGANSINKIVRGLAYVRVTQSVGRMPDAHVLYMNGSQMSCVSIWTCVYEEGKTPSKTELEVTAQTIQNNIVSSGKKKSRLELKGPNDSKIVCSNRFDGPIETY
eukprot:TRINITY_DN556_c0_g5_i1.p1 TRINITY_DN556_c0_g5~~TRINITY_DN556_c0_g5_i1.p1  ORF type:complete len:439 (-),score=75.16 TRINITY_DN556_c0_g5_i1:965-2281(-)